MKDELKTKAQLIAELQDLRCKLNLDADSNDTRTPEETECESEGKYQQLFESASDAIFLLCRETRAILEVNPAAVALYQYRREEMLRMNALEFSAEPEKSRRMMEDKSGKVPVLYHRKKDGTLFPVEILYHDFDYQGRPVRIATIRDITERTLVQATLAESENNLRTFFNTIDHLLFVLDANANILLVNAAVTLKLGYTQEELQGQSVLTVHPPERWDEARCIVAEMLAGKVDYCPVPVLTKAGRLIPVETRVTAGKWSGQDVIFGVTKDLSEIKASEEKFARVFRMNPSPTALSDIDSGKYIAVNASFLRILGYTVEQVVGKTSSELHIFVNPEQRVAFLQKLAKQGFLRNEPALVLTRTGEVRNGIFSAEYIRLQDRTLLLTVMEDVTERIRSEENFQRVFQANPTAQLVVAEENGRILQANATFCRQTGFLCEELVGQTTQELNLWSEPSQQQVILQQLRTEGHVTNVEADFRLKSGEIRTALISFEPVESGGVRCIISSFVDITDRKQAEEALRESEEKYRNLIQQSGDAIYLLYNRRFEMINEKFQEMFCISPAELCRPDFDFINLVAPKSRPMIEKRMQQLAAGEKLEPCYEFTAQDARGKETEVEASVTYIKYKNGMATQGILRDVTTRKKLEEQLRQSHKLETIGTLAGGIAHAFNNLLTPILGYADLAIAGLSPADPLTQDLDQIVIAANRAKELVEQILIFSRHTEKARIPLYLHLIVQEVVKLLRTAIPTTIGIQQRIDLSCAPILADASEMHQVIMNLCTNAFQAMENEGGTLLIELQPHKVDRDLTMICPTLPEGEYVRLSITDTGTGMDAATLNRIFEPFFTTKAPDKGTGMGLSVVHGIVRSHHGEILVTSQPGVGSTFQVYLPATKAELGLNIRALAAIEHGQGSILVVDDEVAIVKMLKKILERLGYQVDGYDSGYEALQMLQAQPSRYDLVISDLTMPDMTGLDLARQIHKIEKKVPIIIMTGYGENVSPAIRGEHGIQNIIGKPIEYKNLAATIRKILDQSKAEL